MANLNPQIVIIGSGISGLAAADRLLKAGFQHVRILEATKRSGGRIKTSALGKFIFNERHCLFGVNRLCFPVISIICVFISAFKFINVVADDLICVLFVITQSSRLIHAESTYMNIYIFYLCQIYPLV